MPHQRKTIRDAIVSAVTGLTTTGSSVFVHRAYPVDTSEMPALVVFTGDEEWIADEQIATVTPTGGTVPQERTFELEIMAHAIGDTYYDTLDQIALEVETALGADLTLAGAVREIWYAGASWEATGELEQAAGTLTLSYAVSYRTDARDPQSNIG